MFKTHRLFLNSISDDDDRENYILTVTNHLVTNDNDGYNFIVKSNDWYRKYNVAEELPVEKEELKMCCNEEMKLDKDNSQQYCKKCGYTQYVYEIFELNQLHAMNRSANMLYTPMHHAKNILEQMQGIEKRKIPQSVINLLTHSAIGGNDYVSDYNLYDKIKQELKKNKLSKYNCNIVKIKNILLKQPPNNLTIAERNDILFRFKIISSEISSKRNIPQKFILHKLINLVVKDDDRKYQFMINQSCVNRKTKIIYDELWKSLCKKLPILSCRP